MVLGEPKGNLALPLAEIVCKLDTPIVPCEQCVGLTPNSGSVLRIAHNGARSRRFYCAQTHVLPS
jgi:hypothetical protein